MCYDDFGMKVFLLPWMTAEVILHLMRNLRLYDLDILKKFSKRLSGKQKIY